MRDKPSISPEALLQATRAGLADRRQSANEQRADELEFMSRHGKIADAYHEKLFATALQVAGVQPDALARRHEGERDSAINFLDERKRRAIDTAGNVRKRHILRAAELTRRLSDRVNAEQSPLSALLKSATNIELSASTGHVSIAPEQNLAHTKVERVGWVSGVVWDLRGDMAVIDWHFLWTPPRDGLLNIVSALSTNGFAYAYPGPGCVKGTASWSVDAQINLAQVGTDGHLFTDSSSVRIDEGHFGKSDMPSYGGVILNGNRLDSMTTLTYQNQFPTVSQTPIAVTVSVTLYVLVAHGEAAINFLDGGFQMNVPFVYLFLA